MGGAAQEATRDYVLSLDPASAKAPLLSVFGGKLTTYRRLAEHALDLLTPVVPALKGRAAWTGNAALPGGDFPRDGYDRLVDSLRQEWPFLTSAHAARLARQYGTLARSILGSARTFADLGADFGATLTAAEVDYSVKHEWTRSADDLVWRRTKLGLRLSNAAVAKLDRHIQERCAPTSTQAAQPSDQPSREEHNSPSLQRAH